MRRVPQSRTRHFHFVKLYLDDFYAICKILQDECESLRISVAGFELDSPQEIQEIDQSSTKDLEITGSSPLVSVSLQPHTMYIRAASDDTKSRGILDSVSTILDSRQRPIRHLFSWRGALAGAALAVIGQVLYLNMHGTLRQVGTILVLIPLLALLSSVVYSPANQGVLVLSRRKDTKTFFASYREQIMIAIIVAVVALVFGLLGDWLKDVIFGSSPASVKPPVRP